ncbi:MAG: hypothetical protein IKU37_02385 [Candidatus Gastranaerophilales bacterium]|nr:hypothetical protein [Candidatus Gastranaerophilales bacterium]
MKKSFLIMISALLFVLSIYSAYAQSNFSQAIKTCENYSKNGSIKHNGEIFNLQITLTKAKNDKCIYREKIHQDKKHQTLTCEFKQIQQDFISDSMSRFNKIFEKEIAKNDIFEAKLTTNAEVFQKYLVDPQYCKITYSKK